MTLNICRETIFLEAAAILHDNDAEFVIIKSTQEAKNGRKNRILFKYRGTCTSVPIFKNYRWFDNGTKRVPRYFSARCCLPLFPMILNVKATGLKLWLNTAEL